MFKKKLQLNTIAQLFLVICMTISVNTLIFPKTANAKLSASDGWFFTTMTLENKISYDGLINGSNLVAEIEMVPSHDDDMQLRDFKISCQHTLSYDFNMSLRIKGGNELGTTLASSGDFGFIGYEFKNALYLEVIAKDITGDLPPDVNIINCSFDKNDVELANLLTGDIYNPNTEVTGIVNPKIIIEDISESEIFSNSKDSRILKFNITSEQDFKLNKLQVECSSDKISNIDLYDYRNQVILSYSSQLDTDLNFLWAETGFLFNAPILVQKGTSGYLIRADIAEDAPSETLRCGLPYNIINAELISGDDLTVEIEGSQYSNIEIVNIGDPLVTDIKVENTSTKYGYGLTISWVPSNEGNLAYVKIYRSSVSGVLGKAIYTIEPSYIGSFSWYGDIGLDDASTYYYTIHSIDTSGNESTNTEQYSGTTRLVSLAYPKGGEKLKINGTYDIKWSTGKSTGAECTANLYKTGFISKIKTIVENSVDDSYSWQIPEDLSEDKYKVGISCIGDDEIKYTNASDYFDILSADVDSNTAASITVTSPNGGEELERGEKYRIKWSSNDVETVWLKYSDGSGGARLLVQLENNPGYYDWIIPDDLPLGDKYKIEVVDPSTVVLDWSDSYFSIVPAVVAVQTPVAATVTPDSAPTASAPTIPSPTTSIETPTLPEGTLVKLPTDSKIYVIKDGKRKWIRSLEEFNEKGYQWSNVEETTSDLLNAYDEYMEAKAKLIKAVNEARVYKIVENKKLWIPTEDAFNKMGNKWEDIEKVSDNEEKKYPRVRLVKSANSSKVYYLTESGYKRHIVSEKVFNSYKNNKWEDIVEVESIDLDAYPDAVLIKGVGAPKVYKIENGIKRWIKTPSAFNKLGFAWNAIAPANDTELNAYIDGEAIE